MERCLDFAPFAVARFLCATFVCRAELVLQCCDCAVGFSPAPMRAGRPCAAVSAPSASNEGCDSRLPHRRRWRRMRCQLWPMRWDCRSVRQAMQPAGCAPQKVHPALIGRFRPAMVGCFWPIFSFADHIPRRVTLRPAIRVPRARKETPPKTGCHTPGRRPGSKPGERWTSRRPGPNLDQNLLGQLRRGGPGLDSEPLV